MWLDYIRVFNAYKLVSWRLSTKGRATGLGLDNDVVKGDALKKTRSKGGLKTWVFYLRWAKPV
jgi:hypothetical protein